MQDLTTGSVTRHLLKTSSFMLVTMVFQTLYFLVDLYWVGRLGKEAGAAAGAAPPPRRRPPPSASPASARSSSSPSRRCSASAPRRWYRTPPARRTATG